MNGTGKMNIEICKKCQYYPDWYELNFQDKFELVFYGYKKTKDSEIASKCKIKHIGRSGTDYSYMFAKFRPETLLKKSRVKPIKEFCMCYAEHVMSEWNENEYRTL